MRAVVFDVGETLFDETRVWLAEAEAAGFSPLVFFAALGALIERGGDHRDVWHLLGVERGPGRWHVDAQDIYPDAIGALRELSESGLIVGVAGNQPAGAVEALERTGLPVAFVASSTTWQVEKPSQDFFRRIVEAAGVPAAQIVYVGDRLDNDILPARRAGMFTVFIRRGPWGYLHAGRPEVAAADLVVETLDDLPRQLRSGSQSVAG